MRRAYRNIGYYFLAILVIVLLGFFQSYLAFVPRTIPIWAHLQFASFLLWFALLIAQPFLIKLKRSRLHRKLGKASYFLIPVLVFSAHMMQRYAYMHLLVSLSPDDRLDPLLTAYLDLFFFVLFYVIAIIFRNNLPLHICYIVGTSLILLNPGLSRLFGDLFGEGLAAELLTFGLQLAVVPGFMIYEHRNVKKNIWKSPWPLLFSLILLKTVLYYILPGTGVWQWVAGEIVRWTY